MPVLPFGEWRPDVSDYMGQHSQTILNVVPRGDGYGPFRSLNPFAGALAGPCRGFFKAIRTDGSVAVFAATQNRLYRLNNTTLAWSDVSKGGAAYTSIPAADQWQFVQFNNFVIAVQVNAPPQVYDLTSSSTFNDLGGSPPQARYVSVVGRFLVLSGLLSFPYRITWSGLNAVTTWTSGVNSSDSQDLPDGGIVRGIAGGEFGFILQDQAIRKMTYAVGSPIVFQIERVAEDTGLYAPYSLVRAKDRIFFLSSQGFMTMNREGYPESIGKERIDRKFLSEFDPTNMQLVMGAADPKASRVFWSYKTTSGAAGFFDKLLCYDYALNRFTPIVMSGEFIGSLASPGTTLEGLDSISSSIDALSQSLDSFESASVPDLAAFDSSHVLGVFNGSTLEATLETSEMGADGTRIFARGFRPIVDAADVYGSLRCRETVRATATQTAESLVDSIGICQQRTSARHIRAITRIPAGTSWTFASGVEMDTSPFGKK